MNTDAIQHKLAQVLLRASSILFPLQQEGIQQRLTPHMWRDRKYVGEVDGKVCVWKGHKINLAHIDSRYRGLYGDYVQNKLSGY